MKITCTQLHEAVRNTYAHPNYMYMQEVRNATGFDANRSADGIAVGLYKSCGRAIHGFEMKVSRTDWQKELSNLGKSESWLRFCHRWALIVPDESIIKNGELPAAWGLGIPYQSRANALPKIKWIVKPPELHPDPFNMVFLTAIMYAARQIDVPAQTKALRDEYDRGAKSVRDSFDRQAGIDKLQTLQKAVTAFQEASGISINDYTSESNANKMGMKFKEWQDSQESTDRSRRLLQALLKDAERCRCAIDNILRADGARLSWEELQGTLEYKA